jgi:hypothetical protein
MTRLSKAGRFITDDLNDLASLHWRGLPVPNHWPGSPRWWFAGLVRETGWTHDEIPASVRERLTPGSLRLWRAIAG